MADVIDFTAERDRRDQPDPEFVKRDGYGRPLYCFGLEYAMDEKRWATEVWAYDWEDAEKRVVAMRESLIVFGQLFTTVPL